MMLGVVMFIVVAYPRCNDEARGSDEAGGDDVRGGCDGDEAGGDDNARDDADSFNDDGCHGGDYVGGTGGGG
ncbi:hypothetical protein NDU88_006058 [Pleurodeles waltl]|uniref:Uncharacterized protein n=1 Tax=Pleurodeles waltl TaxID=8319 RepID=A0AAV7L5W1_PLEWA|nr:hypothetical protein NDU88_006058 [Pleurodeles waltl]